MALLWIALLSLTRTAFAAPDPAASAPLPLRYGVVATNAPVETSADGRHEGLAAATLAQVAALQGIKVETRALPDETSALAALKDGGVDCISLRVLDGTSLPELALTEPYLRSPLALMVRAEPAEPPPPKPRVGVPARDDLRALADHELPGYAQVGYANTQAAVALLPAERADALLGDPITLSYAAARLDRPYKLKLERQLDHIVATVFACGAKSAALRDRLQAGLALLSRERVEQNRRDWLAGLGLAAYDVVVPDDAALPPQGEALAALLAQLEKDTSVPASARDALKASAEQLVRREQDNQVLKAELESLEALEELARTAARTSISGGAGGRELAFLSWRAELGSEPGPGDLWSQAAGAREQIDALRKSPETSLQSSRAGRREGAAQAPAALAFDLSRFSNELPNVPGYSARLLETARLVERRREALEARISVARRRSLQVRAQLLELERLRRDDALALAERKLEFIESELGRSLGARLDPLRAAARRVLAEPDAAPARREQARAILALTDEGNGLAQRLLALNREQDAHANRLHQILRALENTRERLHVASQSTALGLVLVAELERSLPPPEVKARLDAARRDLADVRLRLVALREEPRADLRAADEPLSPELFATVTGDAPPSDQALAAARLRLRTVVESANVGLADTLEQTEQLLSETQRANNELRNLITQRLLWTPSHARIGRDWFGEVAARTSLRKIGGRALEAYDASIGWVVRHPAWAALGAALIAALIAVRPRLWRLIDAQRPLLRSVRTDRIVLTLVALAWTGLLALPWGIGLALVFLALGGGLNPTGTYHVLFGYTHAEFWVGLSLGGLYYLAHDRGAGQHHFGWAADRRRRMRRMAAAAALLLIPGYEFLAAAWYRGNLAAVEFGGRALMMVAWLALAGMGWRMFAPGVLEFAAEREGGPQWTRRLLRLLAAASALSIAVCAALGYELTAAAIARSLTFTIAVLAVLAVGHAFALRWIAIGAKRAAVDAALARREAQREKHETALAQAEREGEQIAQVSAQSRRLVDFVVMVAAVVLLALVWAELLPAVRRLGEIVLWQVSVEREGKTLLESVSVLDLLGAFAAAALMVVGVRTVPSMLDLVLRQREDSDSGTRFAIAALTRYFIVLVGVLATFGLLGVRWGHLQWMAAALTVGLGFGLQEIFANFVSGLIVLFERRVRVGDVVTVGGVTGTVTSISTRASTLLDFDRKEVMVPNKTLITEQLTNWTLTDAVTRIIVKVGVAYGSDVDKVHEALRRAAHEEPRVLEQPEPESFFLGFGPSSLDFELRVFVQRVDLRAEITSALHRRINTLLREAGVSIAFPQMDLWVRSAGPLAPPQEPTRISSTPDEPPAP